MIYILYSHVETFTVGFSPTSHATCSDYHRPQLILIRSTKKLDLNIQAVALAPGFLWTHHMGPPEAQAPKITRQF